MEDGIFSEFDDASLSDTISNTLSYIDYQKNILKDSLFDTSDNVEKLRNNDRSANTLVGSADLLDNMFN